MGQKISLNKKTPWYKSERVIAGAVAAVCGVSSFFGFEVTEDTQNVIVENLQAVIDGLVSLAAVLFALRSGTK